MDRGNPESPIPIRSSPRTARKSVQNIVNIVRAKATSKICTASPSSSVTSKNSGTGADKTDAKPKAEFAEEGDDPDNSYFRFVPKKPWAKWHQNSVKNSGYEEIGQAPVVAKPTRIRPIRFRTKSQKALEAETTPKYEQEGRFSENGEDEDFIPGIDDVIFNDTSSSGNNDESLVNKKRLRPGFAVPNRYSSTEQRKGLTKVAANIGSSPLSSQKKVAKSEHFESAKERKLRLLLEKKAEFELELQKIKKEAESLDEESDSPEIVEKGDQIFIRNRREDLISAVDDSFVLAPKTSPIIRKRRFVRINKTGSAEETGEEKPALDEVGEDESPKKFPAAKKLKTESNKRLWGKNRSRDQIIRRALLPKIPISENEVSEMRVRYLPEGWEYNFIACFKANEGLSVVYAEFKSNITSREDIDQWIKDFMRHNHFAMRCRSRFVGKGPHSPIVEGREYMCHRNGSRLTALTMERDFSGEQYTAREERRKCPAYVRVDVLRILGDEPERRKGNIILRWDHNHTFDESDIPSKEFLENLFYKTDWRSLAAEGKGTLLPAGETPESIVAKNIKPRYRTYFDKNGDALPNNKLLRQAYEKRLKRPLIELSEEQKESLMCYFLPEIDSDYIITKFWIFTEDLSSLEFEFRMTLKTELEAKMWIDRLSEKTGGVFIRKHIVRDTFVSIFTVDYACHRSAPRRMQETVQIQKNRECPTNIKIMVKRESRELLRKDKYFAEGKIAQVLVKWEHTHDLSDSDISPELAASGLKPKSVRIQEKKNEDLLPRIQSIYAKGWKDLVHLSTIDKERIIDRYMPELYPYEVAKCWKFSEDLSSIHVEVRTRWETMEDILEWVEKFKEKTGTVLQGRRAKVENNKRKMIQVRYGPSSLEHVRDYNCHRSCHGKREIKRKNFQSKNAFCPMKLWCAVIRDIPRIRKSDQYIEKNLRGRIRLLWEHTHDLSDSDLVLRKDLDPQAQKLLNSVNYKSLRLWKKGKIPENRCDEDRKLIVEAAKRGEVDRLRDVIISKEYSSEMLERSLNGSAGKELSTEELLNRRSFTMKRGPYTKRPAIKRRTAEDLGIRQRKRIRGECMYQEDFNLRKQLVWDPATESYSMEEIDVEGMGLTPVEDETEIAVDSVLDESRSIAAEADDQLARNPQIWTGVFGVKKVEDVPRDILENVCKIVAHSIRTTWTSQPLTDVLHETDLHNDTDVLAAAMPFIVIE